MLKPLVVSGFILLVFSYNPQDFSIEGDYVCFANAHQPEYDFEQFNDLSKEDCRAECDSRSDCLSYDHNQLTNMCYLSQMQYPMADLSEHGSMQYCQKTNLEESVVQNEPLQSGDYIYNCVDGYQHPGEDIQREYGVSENICRMICSLNDLCKSFDYKPEEHGCFPAFTNSTETVLAANA
eukprot:UN29594